MKQCISTICVFVMVVFFHCVMSAQDNWRMISRDQQRTSWAKNEIKLMPPFNQLKIFTNPLMRSPAFLTYDKGIMYIGDSGNPNRVVAMELQTGNVLWTFDIPLSGASIGNCPVIGNDAIIIGGQSATHIYALNKMNGSVLWSNPVGSMYARSAITDGARLFVRVDSLYCIDIQNGNTLWAYETPGYNAGTPACDDVRAYVSSRDSLYAFDKISGQLLWKIPGAGKEAIAVDDRSVFINSSGSVRAVNKITGVEQWTHSIPDGKNVAYILGNGIACDDQRLVYVVWANKDTVGTITVLKKLDGSTIWSKAFPTSGTFAPTIANGVLYVVNWGKAHLWAFDVQTGNVRMIDSWIGYKEQPIVVDGKLFAIASATVRMMYNDPTEVQQTLEPDHIALHQNFPNPFAQSTAIGYRLLASGHVRLEVFDMLGRKIATLVDEEKEAGEHSSIFDIRNSNQEIPAGLHIYRLMTKEKYVEKKMLKF